MQQLRYNESKAKLSYFYANKRALSRFTEVFGSVPFVDVSDESRAAVEDARAAKRDLAEFLATGPGSSFDRLVFATCAIALGLQEDEAGNTEFAAYDDSAEGFWASLPDALAAFCAVCEYGEAKYLRGNYRKGAPITQYLDSALRHTNARLRGEIIDPESGKPHLAHALWNVWTALDQPDSRDDRLPAVYDPADDFGPESELPEPREEMIPPAPDRFNVTEEVPF